jgi:hypothetical protein
MKRMFNYTEEFPVDLSMRDLFWILAAVEEYPDKHYKESDRMGGKRPALLSKLLKTWKARNPEGDLGFGLPAGLK